MPIAGSGNRSGDSATTRAHWVDAARGIGILLVVYGHSLRGLTSAGLNPATAESRFQEALIYAFHMPLFFFLAGLWVERSLRRGKTRFMMDKVTTIAWPYLLWSVIEGLATLSVSPATNHGMTIRELAGIAVFPIHHFWFLYALFLCHSAAAATGSRLWLMLGVAAFFLLIPLGPFWVLSATAAHLPYYVAGILLARVPSWDALLQRNKALLAGGGWLLFGALFLLTRPDLRPVALPLDLCLGAFGVTGTVGIALILQRAKSLIALGGASMAVYVLHTLFSSGFRIATVAIWPQPDMTLMLTGAVLAGVGGPLLARGVFNRLGLLALLGLGAAPNRPSRQEASSRLAT